MLVKSYVNVSNMVPLEVKFHLEATLLNLTYIGVVGYSGSGKSTFCKTFSKYIVDFDSIVKYIWDSDEAFHIRTKLLSVMKSWDDNLLYDEDSVNKSQLAEFISIESNNLKLRTLMAPVIESLLRKRLGDIHTKSLNIPKFLYTNNVNLNAEFPEFTKLFTQYPLLNVVLFDAPMLIEYGNLPLVNNNVINVVADYDLCKKRIMNRDNIDETRASLRLNSQLDKDEIEYKCNTSIDIHRFGIYCETKNASI